MNYLFVTTAFVFTIFAIDTSWGQMTPNRTAPAPQEQGSQLIPGAQAPFPVITFPASSSEPAPRTAGSGSGSSAPPPAAPQHDVKKQDDTKKPIRVVRKPRERQTVGAGDSAADFLNRQELSRITGAPGY